MSLPTDTRGEAAGSSYFKAEQGQTEILVVGPTVTGYQYWKLDGTCPKSREVFEEPLEGVRMRDKKDKDGNVVGSEPEKQQFYWAMPVYNFKTKAFEVWQITQKGIRDELLKLQNNAKWGDPTGKYTITIDKSGEGFKTEYSVMANPNDDESKKTIAGVMELYKENPTDVADMLFGTSEAPTEAPAEAATPAAEPAPEVATPAAEPAPAETPAA